MLNIHVSLPAGAKVKLWDLTIFIVVNGEKFRSHAVTFTLVRQCPILNLSDIFSYTIISSIFMFFDRLLFELLCKNMETHTHAQTLTSTL